MPVMVAQQAGAGRVVVFAVDTTWRWRQIVGGFTGDTAFYQRFWSQLVRWVARGEREEVGPQLTLGTDRYRYRTGDVIDFTVELRSAESGPTPGPRNGTGLAAQVRAEAWRLTAVALHESGKRLPVALAQSAAGRWRASIAAAEPGRWDIAVNAEPIQVSAPGTAGIIGKESDVGKRLEGLGLEGLQASKPQAPSLSAPGSGATTPAAENADLPQMQVLTVQVDRPDVELLRTEPDPRHLAQLAQAGAGKVLTPDEIGAWARTLAGQPVVVQHTQTTPLWRHPLLVGLFLGLLCTEWLLRRRQRMT